MRRPALGVAAAALLSACSFVLDFDELEAERAPSSPGGDAAICEPTGPHDADPKNCGACGHDCLGGACVGGRCQPVTLVSGLDGVAQLREGGDALFVTVPGANELARVPKAGGRFDVIAVEKNLFNLSVVGRWVYFASDVGAGRVSVDGSPVERLDDEGLGDITADDEFAYRCTYAGAVKRQGLLFRRRHSDGLRQTLAGELTACETVQLAGGAVVYGENGLQDVKGVWTVPRGGGIPVQLVSRPARRIAVDDAYAYFVQYYDGEVRRVPLTGGPDALVASTAPLQTGPGDIAVDDRYVYWVVAKPAAEGGSVRRAPKAGGPAESLVGEIDVPRGIVVDAAAVYWTEERAGTVRKLAK